MLVGKALYKRVKFSSKGRTKAVASPCEATPSGEAILASPMAKRKAFKARPKASQPNRANFQSPRVYVMDPLGPVNTDLRDYLSTSKSFAQRNLLISCHPSADKHGVNLLQYTPSIAAWERSTQLSLQIINRYSIEYRPDC